MIMIRVFSVFYLVIGFAFIINPDLVNTYLRLWNSERKFHIGCSIAVVVLMLVSIAIPHCRMPILIGCFVAIGLIKIAIIYSLGVPKMLNLIEEIGGVSNVFGRFIGFWALLLGGILYYAA